MTRSQILKKLNRQIKDLPTYHDTIPLEYLFEQIKQCDCLAIQEDQTEWQGFLCGQSGQCLIEIKTHFSFKIPIGLMLSWYKMTSGKYEIICYFN